MPKYKYPTFIVPKGTKVKVGGVTVVTQQELLCNEVIDTIKSVLEDFEYNGYHYIPETKTLEFLKPKEITIIEQGTFWAKAKKQDGSFNWKYFRIKNPQEVYNLGLSDGDVLHIKGLASLTVEKVTIQGKHITLDTY